MKKLLFIFRKVLYIFWKICKYFLFFLLICVALFCVFFSDVVFYKIFGASVIVKNDTNQTVVGKVEFFDQGKNLLQLNTFELESNEWRKIQNPPFFSAGEIVIFVNDEEKYHVSVYEVGGIFVYYKLALKSDESGNIFIEWFEGYPF